MSVYAFGSGKIGQLGIDGAQEALDPAVISALKGRRIVRVSASEQTSLAVSELGDVWVWGRGREGQTAQGDAAGATQARANAMVPVRVEGLRHERIVDAVCGSQHCVAVSDTGRVYTWGKLHRGSCLACLVVPPFLRALTPGKYVATRWRSLQQR